MNHRAVAAKLFIAKLSCFNSPGFVKTLNDHQVRSLAQESYKQASIFTQQWHAMHQQRDENRPETREIMELLDDTDDELVSFLNEIE